MIISTQILEVTHEEYHPDHTYTPVSSPPPLSLHVSSILSYQCIDSDPEYTYNILLRLVNGSVLSVTDVVLAGNEGHFSRLFPQSSCCH